MLTIIHSIRTLATLGLLTLGIVRLVQGSSHGLTITVIGALTFLLSIAYWRVEARAMAHMGGTDGAASTEVPH